MRYTLEQRQDVLARLAAGESINAVSQDTGVSRKTIRNWRGASGPVAAPVAEGVSIMDLPAAEAIAIIDRISNGEMRPDDPPVTTREYLEAVKTLEPSRNQRRLAEKNQAEAGLTRQEATDFVRDLLWEVGQRFGIAQESEAGETT